MQFFRDHTLYNSNTDDSISIQLKQYVLEAVSQQQDER